MVRHMPSEYPSLPGDPSGRWIEEGWLLEDYASKYPEAMSGVESDCPYCGFPRMRYRPRKYAPGATCHVCCLQWRGADTTQSTPVDANERQLERLREWRPDLFGEANVAPMAPTPPAIVAPRAVELDVSDPPPAVPSITATRYHGGSCYVVTRNHTWVLDDFEAAKEYVRTKRWVKGSGVIKDSGDRVLAEFRGHAILREDLSGLPVEVREGFGEESPARRSLSNAAMFVALTLALIGAAMISNMCPADPGAGLR